MPNDLYKILGVPRTASDKEVVSAYRKLAKKYHPDVKPGDKKAEEMFKKLSQAHEILGNKEKRARYDRGEIDAEGHENPSYRFHQEFRDGGGRTFRFHQAGEDGLGGFEDIFSGFFGKDANARRGFSMRGGDIRYKLEVDFVEAAKGAKKRITLATGNSLDVAIPAATESGQNLRLKGQGQPGGDGAPSGDALIEIIVRPHKVFRRKGLNIEMDLPVSLSEAVLGGKANVPTIGGPVSLSIPKGSNSGSILRLKGKGIHDPRSKRAGDQLVRLLVMLPEDPDPELEALVREWRTNKAYDPRRRMTEAA